MMGVTTKIKKHWVNADAVRWHLDERAPNANQVPLQVTFLRALACGTLGLAILF